MQCEQFKTLVEAMFAIADFERRTKTKYAVYKATKNFGGEHDLLSEKHRVLFEDSLCEPSFPFDGVPFILLGYKVLDCHRGKDQHSAAKLRAAGNSAGDHVFKRRKSRASKKAGCGAKVVLREIIRFPSYKIQSNSKWRRLTMSKTLRDDIQAGKSSGVRSIVVAFPAMEDHDRSCVTPTGTSGRHCYVNGCSNGDYGLQKWRQLLCESHGVFYGNDRCDCPPPYELFPFPAKRFDPKRRQQWIEIFSRADPAKPHMLFEPCKGHRICSKHFIDGKPTEEHPNPELALGHGKTAQKRSIAREEKRAKKARQTSPPEIPLQLPSPLTDPSQRTINFASKFIMFMLLSVVRSLRSQNDLLRTENEGLSQRVHELRKTHASSPSEKLLTTDKNLLL